MLSLVGLLVFIWCTKSVDAKKKVTSREKDEAQTLLYPKNQICDLCCRIRIFDKFRVILKNVLHV